MTVTDHLVVEGVVKRWHDSLLAKDWNAFAGVYAEDAVLMPPNAHLLAGNRAIAAWFANPDVTLLSFTYTPVAVEVDAVLAWFFPLLVAVTVVAQRQPNSHDWPKATSASVGLDHGQQKGRWCSPDEPTVKAMVAMAKMWADGNCSPQAGLKEVFAEEFQGTGTDGRHYGKAEAMETNMSAPDRYCQIGEVKIQFFGDSVAVAYGNESSLRKDKDGKEWKRCLAWTDTWLKRSGKWQIVAAQDNVVACR